MLIKLNSYIWISGRLYIDKISQRELGQHTNVCLITTY